MPCPSTAARMTIAATLTLAGCAISVHAQTTLTNLGVLPGGTSSEANAISGDGTTVVGRSFISGTGTRAFRWTSLGGMQNLGVLAGGNETVASAVSSDGSVVVGYGSISTGFLRPTRWTAGGGLQVIDIPPSTLLTTGEATGISGDGSLLSLGLGNSTVGVAGRWTAASGIVALAPLPAQTNNIAFAVSADGSTLVGLSGIQATRWTAAGPVGVGTVPGFFSSTARGVSADGSVMTGDVAGLGIGAAFRWTAATGIQSIGTLGGESATGRAVSADGSIIVGTSRNALNRDRAFIWTASAGMRDLTDLLAARGVSIPGLVLTDARGISADGRSITGVGRINNQSRAWLVTGLNLCPSDVAGPNQSTTPDGVLTADDIIVFLGWFFAADSRADVAGPNQSTTPDSNFTADDIIVFLGRFFAGC